MFRTMLSHFTLPLLLLFGISSGNSAEFRDKSGSTDRNS